MRKIGADNAVGFIATVCQLTDSRRPKGKSKNPFGELFSGYDFLGFISPALPFPKIP